MYIFDHKTFITMKIYIFPAILATTILLAANYPKSSTPVFTFDDKHWKDVVKELKEKKHLDSLELVQEKVEQRQKEYLDSIQKSPKFTHFVSEIKQGKVSFQKWLKHKWLGYFQFGKKEAYFSRWEATASYPRGWYGYIWYFFEENLQRTSSDEEKWLMIFVKYYRNAEFIEELFKTYEPQIYQAITQKEFAQGNLKECLEELLMAYNTIIQKKYYKEDFKCLQNADDEEKRQYFRQMAFPDYDGNHKYKMMPTGAGAWFYSFWYRRYTEGNIDVVYKIIHKVYWHYQSQRKSIF